MLTMTAPPVDFHDWAEATEVGADDFPHSRPGPKRRAALRSATWMTVAAVFVWWLVRSGYGWFGDFLLTADLSAPVAQGVVTTGEVYALVNSALKWALWASVAFVVVSAALLFVRFVSYSVNVVQRWRSFERNVVSNDAKALQLRAAILKKYDVHQRLSEFKKDEAERRRSARGSSGSFRRSIDDRNKMEVLRAALKTEVHINTRQSTAGDEIEETQRIEIPLPVNDDQSQELRRLVESWGSGANGITATSKSLTAASFQESPIITHDQRFAVFSDTSVVDGPGSVAEDEDDEVKPEYKPTFPLECFVDRTGKIESAKKNAERFLADAGDDVDNILSTRGISARRIAQKPGSSSGSFIYEMSKSANSVRVEDLADPLKKRFGNDSCDVSLKAGNLHIGVPLPKNCKIPIDVPSMLRESFF